MERRALPRRLVGCIATSDRLAALCRVETPRGWRLRSIALAMVRRSECLWPAARPAVVSLSGDLRQRAPQDIAKGFRIERHARSSQVLGGQRRGELVDAADDV